MILALVSDRRRLAGPDASVSGACRCLAEQIRHAVDAHVDMVQIREGDLDGRILAELVRTAVSAARGTRTQVLVNDRLDVALAAGAAGVHLKAASLDAGLVRAIAPPGFVVGRSVHSVAEAREAGNVDYLIAGTVWATVSKDPGHGRLGPEGLAQVARATTVPTLAIGGVSLERVPDIANAGAAGLAAVGLFMNETPDGDGCRARALKNVVGQVRSLFDRARDAS